jgi:hypothetical protein
VLFKVSDSVLWSDLVRFGLGQFRISLCATHIGSRRIQLTFANGLVQGNRKQGRVKVGTKLMAESRESRVESKSGSRPSSFDFRPQTGSVFP